MDVVSAVASTIAIVQITGSIILFFDVDHQFPAPPPIVAALLRSEIEAIKSK